MVTVSIRPHQIALAHDRGEGSGMDREVNLLRGAVQRANYLGDSVDYQVQVEGSDVVLRISAPPDSRLRPGEAIHMAIPPSACVPLDDEGR
jgi:ABC-type Fe3+/spermidine/putrescine transport system ATPase subunit